MDPIIETTSPILTPNLRNKPTEARDAIAVDRIVLRDDLRLYIGQAWHVVEPSTVYLENWHIDLIAEHFEAVSPSARSNEIVFPDETFLTLFSRRREIAARHLARAHRKSEPTFQRREFATGARQNRQIGTEEGQSLTG